jgi:hypothetical protein
MERFGNYLISWPDQLMTLGLARWPCGPGAELDDRE